MLMRKLKEKGLEQAKVRHPHQGLLTVAEVSNRIGKSLSTVTRWCESGKLPAIQKSYGKKTTYLISPAALEVLVLEEESARGSIYTKRITRLPEQSTNLKPHLEFVNLWIKAMQRGLITGKPFSKVTIQDYEYYVGQFLTSQPIVSPSALQTELMKTPIHQYGKRFKIYKAVVCFAKYLIREKAIDKVFLDEVKSLYPKRHLPPKRLGVDETQLRQLLEVANTPFQQMMVALFVGTGLRVSEAAALRWEDVDFERQTLTVKLGKGNKLAL